MIENFYYNEKIFFWLHAFMGKNELLDNILIFLGEYLIYILILLFLFFLIQQQKNIFIKLGGVIIIWGTTKVIRFFLETARPFVKYDFIPLILENDLWGSFPSGHSTLAFAIAWTVFLTNKKLGFLFLGGAFLVALGRILVGVHYPLDVIVGGIIGWLGALIIHKVFIKKYDR